MADLIDIVAAERHELADVLADLSDQQWNAPSLCAGWRVREVVAHMTMPFRYSTGRFVREMAKSGGRFNRMADRCARHDAQAPPAELLAALRANERHPWQPPGGGQVAALAHDVIHGLDITTALGIDRTVPESHLRPVLASATGERSRNHFHVDLSGKRLCADDLDWTFGDGEPVHGKAQDLLLLLCGRDLPRGVSG